MKVIEQHIQSKTENDDLCEDVYFCNEKFVAVIDGATNVSGELFLGKTPGQLAAITIKDAISGLSGEEDIGEIIDRINQNYEKLYKEIGIEQRILEEPYIRPSASMIIFSKHHRKVWMIGDCQCYFNGRLHQNIKRVDMVFEEVRSIVLQAELLEGATTEELLKEDIGFAMIRPLIRKQYSFQNEDPSCSLSYAVVNGFPIPLELIKTLEVPEHVTSMSFATDGYARIFPTLEETENELQKLLEVDPLCIKENIGTKAKMIGNRSYDDRTYIRVEI
ncbi:glycerophosphoryl diester phosphodiesterase [Planomicrobium sp. HSC-17F08]|nr:glycerophosphoryl diester phosphodiesterase [Planomicrobium sp. HSC-17F08]